MSREVRRVPLDFAWPLRKVWSGYLMPDELHGTACPDCESGWSPRGEYWHNLWYGYWPFDPASTGSPRLHPETPAVRDFAERNVSRAPEYYGTGRLAIEREALRLATLWNGMMCHHLAQADVDALAAADRLVDFTHTWSRGTGWQKIEPPVRPTAAEVNEWSLRGMGHDSINAHVVVRARCEREGVPATCQRCQGHATVEAYPGQRADADAWRYTQPPEGEGWQLWETVSEGSPITPVFATAWDLIDHMVAVLDFRRAAARQVVSQGGTFGTLVSNDAGLFRTDKDADVLAAVQRRTSVEEEKAEHDR